MPRSRTPRHATVPAAGGKPPYMQLLDRLRKAILDGEWKEGDIVPSLRDLAARYGVGLRTVRMALDNLHAEGRITHNSNRRWMVGASRLFGNKAMSFVLQFAAHGYLDIACSEENWAMQRGIHMGLDDMKCPLAVVPSWPMRDFFPSASFFSQPLKGILVMGQIKARVLKKYEKLNVPVVLVDQPGDRYRMHSMSVDNTGGAYKATAHLIEMGHRHIAFVRRVHVKVGDVDPDSRERQTGFLRACKAYGLNKAKEWIFSSFANDDISAIWLERIVGENSPFTAVVAVDAGPAGLVQRAAKERGLSVPEDLSMVTFQGKGGRLFSGPRIDFQELGKRAVTLLDSDPRSPRHERLPCAWYEGQSIACPRTK